MSWTPRQSCSSRPAAYAASSRSCSMIRTPCWMSRIDRIKPSGGLSAMNATSDGKGDTPELTGCRVLLVEDEYFLADDLCRALERCGAEVIGPVPTLDRALPLAETDRKSVV